MLLQRQILGLFVLLETLSLSERNIYFIHIFFRLNPTPFKAGIAATAPFSSSSEEKSRIVVEKREDIIVQPNVTTNCVTNAVVEVDDTNARSSKKNNKEYVKLSVLMLRYCYENFAKKITISKLLYTEY